jgi:hypothetical protein
MSLTIDVEEEKEDASDRSSSRLDASRMIGGKKTPNLVEIGDCAGHRGDLRVLSVIFLVGPAGFEPATNRL